MEVALRPPTHQAAMRADLARYAMILTAGIVLFGAVGTVAGNQKMVDYAESALGALWKILWVVYLSFFAGMERFTTSLRRWLSRGKVR
jgi:fumarate reductase subunit D